MNPKQIEKARQKENILRVQKAYHKLNFCVTIVFIYQNNTNVTENKLRRYTSIINMIK